MFETKTHKNMLESMKEAFTGSVSTGEGSFVESVFSPAALELVEAYMALEQVLSEAFPQTASLKNLRLKAEEYGLELKDGETKEELLERLLYKMQRPSTSGNKNDYFNWAMDIDGVGAAKVFPLKNGAGSVEVAVLGEDKKAVDSEIITQVENAINAVRPVGAAVTVVSGEDVVINITAEISIDSGYELDQIKAGKEDVSGVEDVLTEYFESIAFDKEYVSIGQVGRLLFDVSGVLDYKNLTLNEGTANIALGDLGTPVLGTVTLTKITETTDEEVSSS